MRAVIIVCEYFFPSVFLHVVKRVVELGTSSLDFSRVWTLPCIPVSSSRWEEGGLTWDVEMVAWCHGKDLGAFQQPGVWWIQKHLKQAGPHGRASPGDAGETYWLLSVHHICLSDQQSLARDSPIPCCCSLGVQLGFDNVSILET